MSVIHACCAVKIMENSGGCDIFGSCVRCSMIQLSHHVKEIFEQQLRSAWMICLVMRVFHPFHMILVWRWITKLIFDEIKYSVIHAYQPSLNRAQGSIWGIWGIIWLIQFHLHRDCEVVSATIQFTTPTTQQCSRLVYLSKTSETKLIQTLLTALLVYFVWILQDE